MIEFRTTRAQPSVSPEDSVAYDRIYASEPIRQIDSFYDWLLRLVHPSSGQSLLDVSCGIGRLVRIARSEKLRAVGVDFSSVAIAAARLATPEADFVVGDAERLPFEDRSFDLVMNIGSLEHYQNPEQSVREMARVLRTGGKAVVLVPNTFAIQHVLYAWRHGRIFDDGQPLQRYGTYADWRGILQQNGLHVVQTVKYQRVWPRRYVDGLWYLRHPTKLLQVVLTPLLPLHAAACFVFICETTASDESG